MVEEEQDLVDCPTCGAETRADLDFCLECGHSLGWAGAKGHDVDVEPTEAELAPCPRCGTGLMRNLGHAHPQCESCGYMERH